MSTFKTLAVVAALFAGASTMAMAQTGSMVGSPSSNAASSGGSGSHQSAQKTGSEANTQKVLKNQNGYSTQR